MANSFTLGKDGNFGNIDFNKLRSRITKKDLGIEGDTVLSNIFDSIDNAEEGENKGNGKLEKNELLAFINKIRELAGKDSNVSAKEAKNYEISGDKLNKNKEDLLKFLNKLAELTKGVKNVSVVSGTEIITYEDGHTEQVFSDGSKIITVKNGNKTTITNKNSDDKTTEETVTEDETTTITEYEENSTNPKKQTITNQDTETVILYSNGKKISQKVIDKQAGSEQEYSFDDDGNPILKKSTESGAETSYSAGVPSKKTTTTHTDEGTRVSNITYDGNNSTENISIDGKLRCQKKVIDGIEYEVHYDEKGNTLGVIVQNGESIQAIAKKFGVTPEELIRANVNLLKGKRYFNVGDEIKIPRMMEADEYSKAQEGRLDKQSAIRQFNTETARRNSETERRETERQTKTGDEIARGKNGYYVTKTSDGNLHYWNPNKKEISPEEFKKVCPSIYENVTQTQRGATKRTHNKYDITTIKEQAEDLAKKIHNQIDGASINANTVNLLRGITTGNAAFVISEYQRMFNVSLAKDIDDEWGLDINTVKEHICKKLVDQAKSLGIQKVYHGDYLKINDIEDLQKWIDKTSSKIISTMSGAKETYYATNAEETQRQQSKQLQRTVKESAAQIVEDLIKETRGYNDVDKIKSIIARIDNSEELNEANRILTLKGYPPTDKYSAIENYIYQEANNSLVHTYNSSDYLEQTVQEWINNGTLKGQAANEAQARMAARVMYDGGDGFGTDPEKIKKAVLMIKCPKPTGNRGEDNKQAREVYRLVNNMIKKHNTFYGLGSPSTDLLDYCRGELWESEIKYLKGILAETNAIKGKEKAQAISDLTQEAVEDAGTYIEYLEQAIRGINSPEDRKAVEAKLKEYCQKKGIEPKIAGQSYLQAILYDECDTFMGISTDHKEIRKFNEMLISQGAYTEEEIVNLRAEQAALQILEGSFSDVKDAVEQIKDKEVLAKLEQLLKTKGFKFLDDFLNQNLNSTNSDLISAELASNNLLANEKAANVAYRLMKNSDFDNRAMGVRAIRNEIVAKMVDEKFKRSGSSLKAFMEQFNAEKTEYRCKADFWDGWGKILGGFISENISDAYRENTDSSNNMYVETQQVKKLTQGQKDVYKKTIDIMEQKLAQMEKDYQAALDSQGSVSWTVNRFCEQYGIGTTREEIEARIEHDKETIRLLKLAADGKLGIMLNGRAVPVSFKAVFIERNIGTNFDTAKVESVHQQAEMLGAMDYAKTSIAVCWQEIENGLNSTDAKRLTVAILDTLDKLSTMRGQKLSLERYGYTVNHNIIFDSADNPVPPEKLRELANQLKQGLADIAKSLFGQEIPLNTSSSKINEVLEDAYDSKKESFKQEFKDAFGQDAPDEIIDNYISTINTGKTVINFTAIIGAAIAAPFTGGGSLAVFAAVAGTSFGLNALEKSTDAKGYTNSEWTADAEQALWDGALAAIGMKVGKYAEGFALGTKVDTTLLKNLLTKNTAMLSKVIKNPKTLQEAAQMLTKIEANGYKITLEMAEKMNPRNAKLVSKFTTDPKEYKSAMILIARFEAAGVELTSDTLQSLLQMYCQEGHFDEASFITGLMMSIGGNVLGHTVAAVSDLKGTKSIHDGVHGSTDAELKPSRPHTPEANTHSLDNSVHVEEPKPNVSFAYIEPSKSAVSALFAKLPSVSLRQAGEQIIEKIRNLKNLVDYQEIKNKIEAFYQNYKEVKEQLLEWLDEKFKTIGRIIKHENYKIGEYKYSDYEIGRIIYANDKKTFNNALKKLIPNDNMRKVALEKTIDLGEEFKFFKGEKEITITYDGQSLHINEVDVQAKAKASYASKVRRTSAASSIDDLVKTEDFDRPRTINLLGEDIKVNKIETLQNGEKVLWSEEGLIKLGTNGLPLEFRPKDDNIIFEFTYESEAARLPSQIVCKNYNDEVLKQKLVQGDRITELDYVQGTKSTSLMNGGDVLETSFLKLEEYPKVIDQDCYVINMQSRILKATSLEELENLKKEFAKFKSEYSNITDLSGDFDVQAQKLLPKKAPVHEPSVFEQSNLALNIAKIEKFGKDGIPLLYNLSNMSEDLCKYIAKLPPSEKFQIYKKFNITFTKTPKGNVLIDIPNLSAEATTEAQKKVLEILTTYTKKNKIIIDSPKLEKELEDFINDVPEFMFMIGKPQNGVHFGSLDVHTLSVLNKALEYADDAHLSNEQKDILKMAVMLHDMGKKYLGEFKSDTGHAALSKEYAQKILDRFSYSQEVKDKILNLIDNHHWFKDYNKNTISADDVFAMFGDDLEIAKVFAKADLESVSNDFHLDKLGVSTEAEYKVKMQEKLDAITAQSSGAVHNADAKVIGLDLPMGELKYQKSTGEYIEYHLDFSKVDTIKIGNVEVDFNDPKLKQLMDSLKDGESFAIGCTNPKTSYADVKYQIGKYEDGVASHHLIITKKGSEFTISAHKPATINKNIPTKKTDNPSIAKKIEQIKSHGTKSVNLSLNIEGKEVPFELLKGYSQGSNGGYYAINKLTGDLYFIKEGAGTKSEIGAAKLYEAAGIEVPEISYFKMADGTVGMISKFIPDLTPVMGPCQAANDAFGMNVLLANWDAVISDNTCLTKDGKAILIDCGGSLDHHAHQSSLKPFKSIPTEILTFMDGYTNYGATKVYSLMTRDDLIKSLKKAVSLTPDTIKKVLDSDNLGMSHYLDTILERQKFLKTLLNKIEETPINGKPMYHYLQDTMSAALEDCIVNAKTIGALQDIEEALHRMSDQHKIKLQQILQEKKAYLISYAPKIHKMSKGELINYLGLKQTSPGVFTFEVSPEIEKLMTERIGHDEVGGALAMLKNPLSKNDLSKIQTMIQEASKCVNVSGIEPYQLILVYNTIKDGSSGIFNHMSSMKPAMWATVLNIAKQKLISGAQIGAFMKYKGSSSSINWSLSALRVMEQLQKVKASGQAIPDNVMKQIDNVVKYAKDSISDDIILILKKIQCDIDVPLEEINKIAKYISPKVMGRINDIESYIGTQVIPEEIILHRTESYYGPGNPYGCLSSVQMPDGRTMQEVLEEAIANGTTDKLEAQIKMGNLDYNTGVYKKYVAKNERFTSTRLLKSGDSSGGYGRVVWEFHVKKGSKGAFMEGNNWGGSISSECEVLLQKDSEFTITDIKWDSKIGKWCITADVTN